MTNNEHKSYAFNRRYLVVGVLSYILGTYIGLNFKNLTAITPNVFTTFTSVFAVVSLCIASILCIAFRKKREASSLIFGGFLFILIFVCAFSRTYFFLRSCEQKRDIIDKHPSIVGVIKTEPTLNSSDTSYIFDIDVYDASSDTETISFDKECKIRMYVDKDSIPQIPQIYDSVSCKIESTPLKDIAFDGAFDFGRNLLQHKIVYAGYTSEMSIIESLSQRDGVLPKFEKLGLFLRNKILQSTEFFNYADNEKQLLKGILVGYTEDFSDELYAKYSASGFIHITSVSGMHTSYLFLIISIILGIFRFPKRYICFIAIPVLFVFASVSLFTPSVCRAVITMSIFLSASIFRRNNDSITSLAIAGLLLLIENPLCLENCSALLSFGATLGILIYFPLIKDNLSFAVCKPPNTQWLKKDLFTYLDRLPYKLSDYSVTSVALSLSATIGIVYFMAHFFGYIQWGSILGNILIFPAVAIAFIFGYVNCLVGALSLKAAYFLGGYIVNPPLFITNVITSFFAHSFFGFKVPYLHKSFFPVYIVICYSLYILLTPQKRLNK